MRRLVFALLWVALAAGPAAAAEWLVYAVRHEDLDRRKYPDVVWTRIGALDPVGGARRELFSDQGSSLMVLFRHGMPGYPGEVIATAGGRLFAHAVEGRADRARGFVGPAAIYELSTDGSNAFRKVADVRGSQGVSDLFVDPTATRLGYLDYDGSTPKRAAFVHEAATGALAATIDVDRLCAVCFVRTAGWLRDGRLFLTLERGPEDAYSRQEYRGVDKKVGTYFLDPAGGTPARLPAALVTRTLPKGFRLGEDGVQFVGPLPDGAYLLLYGGGWARRGPDLFLGVFHPTRGLVRRLPISRPTGVRWMKLAPSGRWLAFTDTYGTGERQHLVIKDLDSGAERIVTSFPLVPYPRREEHVGLVGWLTVGAPGAGAQPSDSKTR